MNAKIFDEQVMIKKRKRKKDLTNAPACFGSLLECNKKCRFKDECKNKFVVDEKTKEERKREKRIKGERLILLSHYVKMFFKNLFSPFFWIQRIHSVESLIEVVVIDFIFLILAVSCAFVLYFLCKSDWRMALCSIVLFIACGFVLERFSKNKGTEQ